MNAHNEQQALPCPFCGREPDLSFNSVSCGCAASPFIDREDALQVWNTRAAQPSPVVKQNLTTQPAAAQLMPRADAIRLARTTAFMCHKTHGYLPKSLQDADTWEPHEWVVLAIQAAALNASERAKPAAAQEAVAVVDGPDRGAAISSTATLIRAMPSGTKLFAAPVTAAPGIDASPKGAAPAFQVPAGWSLVRTEPTAEMLDAGINEIDYDGNEVTDNVRNVWLAMIEAARKDSPKGGSEAEVQELVAADLAYDAAEQALVDHYKPTLRRDAGWHLEQERLDAIADSAIARRSAALAAMQASDAEGRP